MLITTILSALGLSVLADDQDDEQEEYYTIFEWNDGMKMQRDSHEEPRFNIILRCGNQFFYLYPVSLPMPNQPPSYIIRPSNSVLGTYSVRMTDPELPLIGQRIAWLVFVYLKCKFSSVTNFEKIGIPQLSPDQLLQFANEGAPDKADPYEMVIYETGQMDKSMFLMGKSDFLRTIGKL